MHKSDYYEACYVINLKRTDNGDDKMVTAIVLLTVEKDKVHSIAEKLADMKEITKASHPCLLEDNGKPQGINPF